MFERYDEKARRTVFFARYEASETGSPTIEPLHLLLGLLRENGPLFTLAHQDVSADSLMDECRRALPVLGKKIPTHIDLPLSSECKRALAEAASQAAIQGSNMIRPVHLLLGLIESSSDVAAILERYGITGKILANVPMSLSAPTTASRPTLVLEFVCQGERIASSPVVYSSVIPRTGEEVVLTRETKMYTYKVIAIRHEFAGPEGSVNCELAKVVVECERVG